MSHRVPRWTRLLAMFGTGVLVLVVTILALLQVPPVATWVMRRVLTVVPLDPGYRLEVGRVSGDWLHHLALEDVRLWWKGRELALIDRLTARYDLRQLRGAETRLQEVTVTGARAEAHREANGWDLASALKHSADTARTGGGVRVDRVELRGVDLAVELSPDSAARVRGLNLSARDLRLGDTTLVELDQLNAAISPPASGRWFALETRGSVTAGEYRLNPLRIQTEQTRIAGALVLPRNLQDPKSADRLDVRFQASPLALADLAAIVPSLTSEGDLQLDGRATGTSDGLITAHLGARLDEATLTLDGHAPLVKGSGGYRLHCSMQRLDPARLYRTAPVGAVNGTIDADLRGAALNRSEGAVAVRIGPSRLAGTRVRRLELRTNLSKGSAVVALRGALEKGTLVANGRVRPFDSIPSYRLSGTASGIPNGDVVARKWTGDSTASGLDVRFQLAGAGTSAAKARVAGNVSLAALRPEASSTRAAIDPVSLGNARFTLARGRLELDPHLLVGGGSISAQVITRLADTLSYEVRNGRVDRVSLSRLGADSTLGPLSARFALTGRGTAPNKAVASLQVQLEDLQYGSQQLRGLTGTLRLARGNATASLDGPLSGGRLSLAADARPFDETRTFHLRRASLDRVNLGALLSQPRLAGPLTLRATADGRQRGEQRSVRGRVTLEPSQLGAVKVTRGIADLAWFGKQLTYDATVSTNGGTLALAGEGRSLGSAASFIVRRGRVDSVDLGVLLANPQLHTGINASFTARWSGDSIQGKEAGLQAELLPSQVNQAELQGGTVAVNVSGDSVQGRLRLQGRDGDLAAQLDGQTGEAMQIHSSGNLRLERLARWTGRSDADGRIESKFDLNAVGDSAGLVSLGGTIDAIGGVGDIHLNSAHVAFRPDSGAIRLDTLVLRSNVAALSGRGAIALRKGAKPDTLRITGLTYNISPIAALIGDSISLDSARVALAITGPAWGWKLQGNAQIDRLLAGGNLADRVTLRANVGVDSSRISALEGELVMKGGAWGKTRIPNARLTGRYDSLLVLDGDVALGDSVRVITALLGTVRSDTMRATLKRLDLIEQGDSTWSLEEPAQLELRPRVSIDNFALRSGRHRITIDGVFDPRNESDITAHITDLDLEALRSLALSPIGGRLDGWFRLQGPGTDPSMRANLALQLREPKGRDVGRLQTNLTWNREGLRINAAAMPLQGGRGRLTVDGTLPWRLTLVPSDSGTTAALANAVVDTLGVAVRADSFDLAVLDPLLPHESAHDLRGRLLAQAEITGTLKAARADGMVQIAGAGLTVPALGLSYRGGALQGQFSGDALHIQRLELHTDKKEVVTAEGNVLLRPLSDPALDLTARLSNFRVSNSDALQAVATGDVRLQGTAAKPTLTGSLTMGRTDIVVGAGTAAATAEKVELTPEDLRQVARVFGPAAIARASKSPGVVDRFHLDLDLRLPRQVWFRRRTSPQAEIELSGRIRLTQQPGQPMQFFGRVQPLPGRGNLNVYGREFRLTGGDITLNGPTDSTMLNVTAEYQVPTQGGPEDQGILITVVAKGHPDSLSLEFTGDPEMSQEDMLSYIVTGRPASDNPLAEGSSGGRGMSTGEMGAQVAMSGLTSSLSSAAEKELGLDVFQIRQEGLRGLTLTAGRYVGSSVFLSMHLPIDLGSDVQQLPGGNLGPSFELEYVIQRWLRADVQGGNVPPRFTLRSRYAY